MVSAPRDPDVQDDHAGRLTVRDWLAAHRITVGAMEATGVFCKPIYYMLEDDPKWLRAALGESARAASRTKNTYLAAHYQRIKRARGGKKAAVAVGHTILVAAYHMRDDVPFADLGADYFQRGQNTTAHVRRLVRQLESLGHRVTLEPLPESA
jgi:hypothetical protein